MNFWFFISQTESRSTLLHTFCYGRIIVVSQQDYPACLLRFTHNEQKVFVCDIRNLKHISKDANVNLIKWDKKSRRYCYYTNKISKTIIPTTHNPAHNQNQTKNFPLIVLWRKNSIAPKAPSHPPAHTNRRSVFSLILHLLFLAFHLSIPRTINVVRLMSKK